MIQPLTFLTPPSSTENKIHLFIKKLKNRDFGDFPFFPMFSSQYEYMLARNSLSGQ